MSDDERTTDVGLFNFAHSYWASAAALENARVKATHPDSPICYLYFHSIELFLKAHLRHSGLPVKGVRQLGHNVERLAEVCSSFGLQLDPEELEVIRTIPSNYISSRYIITGYFSRPRFSALWATCFVLFDSVGQTLVASGKLTKLMEVPFVQDRPFFQ